MNIHEGDRVIVKALNIDGVVCQKGKETYFKKMDGIHYCVTLNYTDDNTAIFRIQNHHILEVYDHMTNSLIYRHNPQDAL